MTTRLCIEHGRTCQPWQHVVPKEKLRAYALGPVRLDLELPELSVGALDWLLGHRLGGGLFYSAWARREQDAGRFVYGDSDEHFAERWSYCTGRGERLVLRWIVFGDKRRGRAA